MTMQSFGGLLWGLFFISWIAAVVWTAPAIKDGSRLLSLRDTFFYILGFGLLFSKGEWFPRLWDVRIVIGSLLLAAEILSFAFAWWARIHLGNLWSGKITLRTGHRVITTGPYRLVRHPIYTALIGASWALALLRGFPTSLLGAAILTGQMIFKARREEAFLRAELGAEAYDTYAARTPMILPRLIRPFTSG
jgi:protein-S-isoprenylcysteine O-methyltransferase Ste14